MLVSGIMLHRLGALILMVMAITEVFSLHASVPVIGYLLNVLRYFNFLIHETGHFPFCMGGMLLCALGGTLGQLIVPLLLIGSAARQASITVWMFVFWLGQNLLSISVYMADARAKQLSLFMPGMLFDPQVNPKDHHDWEKILGQLHLLWADQLLAAIVYFGGVATMLGAICGCFFAVETSGLPRARMFFKDRISLERMPAALLEEFYDLKLKWMRSRWPRIIRVPGKKSKNERQTAFFTAVFSMLGKFVVADGKVGLSEIEAVENFMKQELRATPEQHILALRIFRTAKNSQKPFEAYAKDYYQLFRYNKGMLENALYTLLVVAYADTRLSVNEEKLIHGASRIFQLTGEDYKRLKNQVLHFYQMSSKLEELRAGKAETGEASREAEREQQREKRETERPVDELGRAFELLGCKRTDSLKKIKQAYRKRALECHPDRAMAQGLPPEFVKLAQRRFQELQDAYERVIGGRA